MNDQRQSTTAVIFRWIAVLPSALLAYAILQVLFAVLGLLLAVPLEVSKYISQIIATVFCPYYFVYIGAKVAPSGRVVIAMALAVLLALTYCAIVYLGFVRSEILSYPMWYLIVSALLGIGSAIFAAIRVRDDVLKPPVNEPRHWKGAIAQVTGNIFGIVYVYAYIGQAVLFAAMFWSEMSQNWLNIFNPLLDFENIIAAIFSWYFWVLVAVAAAGYFAMNFFLNIAQKYVPEKETYA